MRDKDGSSQRDTLESVARQTGRRPADLDGPAIPPDGQHIWAWFLDLNAARGSNGWGPNPISWTDVAAWVQLTGIIVRPAEIEGIMALDREWMQLQADQSSKKQKGG